MSNYLTDRSLTDMTPKFVQDILITQSRPRAERGITGVERLIRRGLSAVEITCGIASYVLVGVLDTVSKARTSLDIPDFQQAVIDEDLPKIVRLNRALGRAEFTPRAIYYIALAARPGLSHTKWDELIKRAYTK